MIRSELLKSVYRYTTSVWPWLPGSELVVMPGVGHMPHEENADVFLDEVRAFIATGRRKSEDAVRMKRVIVKRSDVKKTEVKKSEVEEE